ncbi:19302_t:CDS:1, partial [Gigaspora margarita]
MTDEWNHTSQNSQISQTNNSHAIDENTLNVTTNKNLLPEG